MILRRLALIVLMLATCARCEAQVIVTPVSGVATIDIGTCGQGGASPNPSCSFKLTLTANTTITFNNVFGGVSVSIFINPGSFTVTWPSSVSPTPTLTAGQNNLISLRYDGASNQWTGIGGSGGVPGQFSVKAFGAVGDAKKSTTTTLTNTQNTITDTANPFLSTDVGKFIFCIFPGDGTTRLAVGTKISTFVSAGSITVSNNATGTGAHNCVWYTQKETTGFQTAFTAAKAALNVGWPANQNTTVLAQQSTVVCPPGGYVLDGVWINENNATIQLGVNWAGAGKSSCIIYQSPDITATNSSWHWNIVQATDFDIGGFTIDCLSSTQTASNVLFRLQNVQGSRIHDITMTGCGSSGSNNGKFLLSSVNSSIFEQINDATGSPGNNLSTFSGTSVATTLFRNITTTNPGSGPSLVLTASGAHGQTGGFNTVIGGIFDEGSAPGPIQITNGTDLQIIGATLFSGTIDMLDVDGTSTARLEDVNLIPFSGSCSGGTRNAIKIASGGIVTATNSTIQGCGATGAISGPAGAQFVDIGGNDIRNCPANGGANPCNLVTPATFATLGYSGGINPKSTQTHTPNTCYAVTGNLLTTAQNICTILLDQNYQVLNITAQSGGTTPANSSCTGAPVITMSDGTRTATLTMTTGKTSWSSSVDVAAVGTVMASGATLTVSIGANTCATPPANVSVNYVLQSVLNP